MTSLSKTSWELLESIISPFLNEGGSDGGSANNTPMDPGQLFKLIHMALPGESERKVLEASVELLEKDGSTGNSGGQYRSGAVIHEYIHATSKRKVWKVAGSSSKGSSYLCFRHYCSCPSYAQVTQKSHATTVVSTFSPSTGMRGSVNGGIDTHVLCKHLLAIRLAKCLNMVESHTVDTANFLSICCSY